MAVCTFDNPAHYRRECWLDGELMRAYSAALLCQKDPIPGEYFFFGANIGPWEPGRLVGDPEAMPEKYRGMVNERRNQDQGL